MPEPDGAAVPVCVGTSHRVAPVPFIERALARAERYRDGWLGSAKEHGSAFGAIHELVLLATCNRVEVWAAVGAGQSGPVADAIRTAISSGDDGSDRVYALNGPAAVRHLCRVTAGLDSMVVGEPQIAGQVARSFRAVLHANGGAPVLRGVADVARLASRRARSRTAIGRGPASISTVAVHVAAEQAGGLDGRRVLVAGAGKIGRLACQVLRDRGARLTVVNRTVARAEQLAARVGARALPLDDLAIAIADSDVVITSTSAPRPIIDATMLRPVLGVRPADRPLLIIDISVPRNVAQGVGRLAGLRLLGIDDLRRRVRAHLEKRCREIPRAESIIDETLREHGVMYEPVSRGTGGANADGTGRIAAGRVRR